MIWNLNGELNRHFGVFHGMSMPWLLEKILTEGRDTWRDATATMVDKAIRSAFHHHNYDPCLTTRQNLDRSLRTVPILEDFREVLHECLDVATPIISDVPLSPGVVDKCKDAIMEKINESCPVDEWGESPHDLSRNDEVDADLELDYLGGAPLVWVTWSKWIALCSPCSPCVKGAVDLDSPSRHGLGCCSYGLCLPPLMMQELAISNRRTYWLREIDSRGSCKGGHFIVSPENIIETDTER